MMKPSLWLFMLASTVVSATACLSAQGGFEVTVKKNLDGCMVSVNSSGAPLNTIACHVGEECGMRFSFREKNQGMQPVCVRFQDLSLKQAIKKLLHAVGINNYLLHYRGDHSLSQPIAEIIILSSSTKPKTAPSLPPAKQGEPTLDMNDNPTYCSDSKHEYAEKIAAIKTRYLWEDEETCAWAAHLLEAMPAEVKAVGLDKIIRELDTLSGPHASNRLNQDLFYRAIEAAAPPPLAPAMLRLVKRLSKRYHKTSMSMQADAPTDERRNRISALKETP